MTGLPIPLKDRWRSQAQLVGELIALLYFSLRSTAFVPVTKLRPLMGVVGAQVYFTSWQSWFMVSSLAGVLGFATFAQMSHPRWGLGDLHGVLMLLQQAIVFVIAPLLTTLIIIARSVTAVATELGNMKVNREVQALLSMGIHPLNFIVLPRLIAGVVSVIILGFYTGFFVWWGAALAAWWVQKIPLWHFWREVFMAISPTLLAVLFLKYAFIGLVIFLLACWHGLKVELSPTEVPVATTQAVVRSLSASFVIHAVLSLWVYV
ncbi:MAG: ABC transporter permease [Bdellovibrionaceae bacterium]|jgi:phospholipid/cholesterol/gamma-HCH transport system permease protein|nr:ABC transporter permease [Pseudobdellovibrionaceae bacterium]